jgi:molybdopterin molybdotransferase
MTNKIDLPLLSFDEALKAVLDNCRVLTSEKVALADCLRRVLAEPLIAGFDLPQFNNSAVDGFGILVEDLIEASDAHPVQLKIVGEVAAGQRESADSQSPRLAPGQCIRILTGAPVPSSVEAVLMKEICPLAAHSSDTISVSKRARIGENIRMQGEEIESGATVLKPGELITPPVLGLIATLGLTEVTVYRNPRVAIIATGDELIEPGTPLQEGQIYNSNSYALAAALHSVGVKDVVRLHARDSREETMRVLNSALADADIIISAGGVSVGEYDFVKDVCEEQGIETVFWRTAIKPGKPVYFGVKRQTNQLVFGLPGNPVSALVTFNLFVRPALARVQGTASSPQRFRARAARNLKKNAGRLDFMRGNFAVTDSGELSAMPTTGQESHMLTGLARANCLMELAREAEFIAEGDTINIRMLSWFE